METNFRSLRFYVPPLIGMLSFATFLIIDPRYNFINLITEYGVKIEYIFGTIFLIITLGYIINGITIILSIFLSFFLWKGKIGWHYEIPIKKEDFEYLSQKLMGLDKITDIEKNQKDFAVSEIFLQLVLPKISQEIYNFVVRGWHAFATALSCITSIIIFFIFKCCFCCLDKITALKNINFYSLRPMNRCYTSFWFIGTIFILAFFILAKNSHDYLKEVLGFIIRNKSFKEPIKNILKLKDPDFKTVNLPKNAVL